MRVKISISGASGFVGSNLVPYLIKHGFSNVNSISRDEFNNIDNYRFEKQEVFIHLAGKAHDLKKSTQSNEYYDVNYLATCRLYDAFLRSDASKFIFMSSVKACADTVDGILTEEDLADPKTDYGKSKLLAEDYIRSKPLPSNKSYFILRPCMIHGPGNKGNLNLLFNIVKLGIPYPLAGFANSRSFLSIENLLFVLKELIINTDIKSNTFNVADDASLSTNEVIHIFYDSLKMKSRLWKLPTGLIRKLSRIGDKLSLPLNTERLIKLTESYVVSNEKLKNTLEISLPVKSIDGLRMTAASFGKK